MQNIISTAKKVWADSEIPGRDKFTLFILVCLVLSPIDINPFIPDFLLPFGILDDIVVLSTIFDYFFGVLDPQILRRNSTLNPGTLRTFMSTGEFLSKFMPKALRGIWKYKRKGTERLANEE